jgi:hypothetical protein
MVWRVYGIWCRGIQGIGYMVETIWCRGYRVYGVKVCRVGYMAKRIFTGVALESVDLRQPLRNRVSHIHA